MTIRISEPVKIASSTSFSSKGGKSTKTSSAHPTPAPAQFSVVMVAPSRAATSAAVPSTGRPCGVSSGAPVNELADVQHVVVSSRTCSCLAASIVSSSIGLTAVANNRRRLLLLLLWDTRSEHRRVAVDIKKAARAERGRARRARAATAAARPPSPAGSAAAPTSPRGRRRRGPRRLVRRAPARARAVILIYGALAFRSIFF